MNRLEAIQQAGLKAIGVDASSAHKKLVLAMGAMIAEAVGRPRKPKAAPDLSKLPYSPGQVFEELEKHCSDVIQLRPYETASFGRLGKSMAGIVGLELADLHRVTSWIQSGALAWWTQTITWSHVVRHYPTWVGYARRWECEGGGAVQEHYGHDSWR